MALRVERYGDLFNWCKVSVMQESVPELCYTALYLQ